MICLIQIWSCRNITPIGRITVLQSLVFSKIIHILQSLPSPSITMMQELKKMSIDFIWKKKRHEVSKKTLYLKCEQGGLNLINIQEFDLSLKLTWLRKSIYQSPDWLEFFTHYKLDRLLWTGTKYHESIKHTIKNPFWNNVREAFLKWYKVLDDNNEICTEYQPIWGNVHLDIPFNDALYRNNIIFIKDLYDQNGRPLTKEDLEQRIGQNIMFLTYQSIWRALPRLWKDELQGKRKNFELELPPVLKWIIKDKKGTKSFREIWSKNNTEFVPKGQEKWSLEFVPTEVPNWKKIHLITKVCKMNARTIYFQYQITHRSLVTNRKLFMFGLRDNENCEICDTPETITHLLYDCTNAQKIWTDISRWLRNILRSDVHLDKLSILLGNPRNEILTNCIILIVKHEIYKQKWNKNALNLFKLKRIIKSHMELDIYLGTMHSRPEKTIGKWSSIYNDLHH